MLNVFKAGLVLNSTFLFEHSHNGFVTFNICTHDFNCVLINYFNLYAFLWIFTSINFINPWLLITPGTNTAFFHLLGFHLFLCFPVVLWIGCMSAVIGLHLSRCFTLFMCFCTQLCWVVSLFPSSLCDLPTEQFVITFFVLWFHHRVGRCWDGYLRRNCIHLLSTCLAMCMFGMHLVVLLPVAEHGYWV